MPFAKLHATYFKYLKKISGLAKKPEDHVALADVLAVLDMDSLRQRIAKHRLHSLERFLSFAPKPLLALSQSNKHPHSWAKLVANDVDSLQHLSSKFPGFVPCSSNPQPWIKFMRAWPREWHAIVKTCPRPTMCEASMPVQSGAPLGPDDEYICDTCASVFPTIKQLRSHQWLVHSKKHPARRWCYNGICPVCSKDFGIRTRCMEHVTQERDQAFGKFCRSKGFSPTSLQAVPAFTQWVDGTKWRALQV